MSQSLYRRCRLRNWAVSCRGKLEYWAVSKVLIRIIILLLIIIIRMLIRYCLNWSGFTCCSFLEMHVCVRFLVMQVSWADCRLYKGGWVLGYYYIFFPLLPNNHDVRLSGEVAEHLPGLKPVTSSHSVLMSALTASHCCCVKCLWLENKECTFP